jgi:hypothetical protein
VPDPIFRDEAYRWRCQYEVARLQHLFELEGKTATPKVKSIVQPTYEELKVRVAAFEKEHRSGSLQFKVSGKGGVSVYGLHCFPVTLYYEQWLRLLDAAQKLHDFLEANKASPSGLRCHDRTISPSVEASWRSAANSETRRNIKVKIRFP